MVAEAVAGLLMNPPEFARLTRESEIEEALVLDLVERRWDEG